MEQKFWRRRWHSNLSYADELVCFARVHSLKSNNTSVLVKLHHSIDRCSFPTNPGPTRLKAVCDLAVGHQFGLTYGLKWNEHCQLQYILFRHHHMPFREVHYAKSTQFERILMSSVRKKICHVKFFSIARCERWN